MANQDFLQPVARSLENDKSLEANPNAMLKSTWTKCLRTSKIGDRVTIVMRSAERVDRVFGSNWEATERPANTTHATDLNVNTDLPLNIYKHNPPITNMGKYSTQLTARALINRGLTPSRIFCSPALRSIQTAAAVAKLVGVKICVEPGLLEPMTWYRTVNSKTLPTLCDSLYEKYPIDKSYTPIYTADDMRGELTAATQEECISRIEAVLQSIFSPTTSRDGCVLVVGHAVTLEITSQLGKFGFDLIGPDLNTDDDVTSFEAPTYKIPEESSSLKLDLGVKFPAGSVVAVSRANSCPPYIYKLMENVIVPLTSKHSTTKIVQS